MDNTGCQHLQVVQTNKSRSAEQTVGAEDLKSTLYPFHDGFVWGFFQTGCHSIPAHEYPFAAAVH